jgi:DNA processing protein
MGEGRGHEIVLSLILSGVASTRRINRLLRSVSGHELVSAGPDGVAERLGITDEFVGTIRDGLTEASAICAGLRDSGAGILMLCEGDYPCLLKEISVPPPLLFCRGTPGAMSSRAVAIVGSRRASLAGLRIATSLAKELAGLGFTIMSGLARGIDTAAHRGALEAGGKTVGVMGCGIDMVYPSENEQLARSIVTSGTVVTEQLPGTPPIRQNFPQRNRIISGLALGPVVVEAGEKSGALITANCALEQNRSVFAVPSTPGYAIGKGTNSLLKEGAVLVETVDDIIRELEPQLDSSSRSGGDLFATCDLTPEEERLLGLLSAAPVHVDEISRGLSLESHEVLSMLLSLETRGLVRSVPGKFYVRDGSV